MEIVHKVVGISLIFFIQIKLKQLTIAIALELINVIAIALASAEVTPSVCAIVSLMIAIAINY